LRRCHRTVSLGHFTHSDRAGPDRFRFTGRVKGAALRPGRYKLRAVPLALGLKGTARTTGFKIVK
jgi:hypothetical protein